MNSPEQQYQPESLSPEEQLARLGLSPESFHGKNILAIHAGQAPFGEDPKKFQANFMTDYDPSWESVEDDMLPFKTPRFDFVTATEGVLREDPENPAMFDLLSEAVRVCNEGGEVRIYDPFQDYDIENGDPVEFLRYSFQNSPYILRFELVVPDESNNLSRPYLKVIKDRSTNL